MRSPWSAAWKATVVVLACLCAFYVTVKRNGGGFGFGISTSQPARAQTTRGRTSTGRPAPDPNYDLTAMTALRFTLMEINNSYVDPSRVHPREMLLRGLDAIQRDVAQVLVRHEEDQPTVTVRVDTNERQFQVADVNSPWDLERRWREIFGFLQQHLRGQPDVNLQEIEYAAANGMLRTLDPHSVLLSPEAFHDMQIQTSGHFGGLGIVISIRDGLLTIMNPMPNTPASRAGLRRYDRIVQINNESTMNMSLQEAVNRLRGEEGSTVNIYVTRAGTGGFTQPRRFELTRAVIQVDSVEHRMLANGVGYARIKSFSEDTAEELSRALQQMHAQNMRSLVLDMRGNPGGLLEQAVEVADLFLREGVIVVTAGNRREGRDQREAQERGTEPNYPIVVLIDGGSASASEIVAGALKNNNRALIVGQTSFGKGSVQTIRNLTDGGALKITIAQYLTPGDVSIQGVGITPDIELDAMTVDSLDMDLDADRAYLREADLSAHLTSNRAREGGRASETVQYYLPFDEREAMRERGADDNAEESPREDFPIRFAREMLGTLQRAGRREMLQDARPMIDRTRETEMSQVTRALAALPTRVDWSTGPDSTTPTNLDVNITTSRPEAVPGESFDLTVAVTNRGTAPVYRLRATTKSDNPLFENRELVFGRINPGETRTWTAPLGLCLPVGYRPGSSTPPPPGTRRECNVPRATLSRQDAIRLEFSELHNHVPTNVQPQRASVRGLDRPVFAYGWQLADNVRGNGDGRIQRGEQITAYFSIRNVGRGRSFVTQANLKNLSGQGVVLHAARFHVDNMQPNAEQQVAFTFEVQPDFRENEIRLEFQIEDEDLREFVTERLRIPLADTPSQLSQASGQFVSQGDADLLESPANDGRIVGRIPAGFTAPIAARMGEFMRVTLPGTTRPVWVRSNANGGRPAPARPTPTWVFHNSPPMIESDAGANLAIRGNQVRVTGRATDQQRVLDLYIFVGQRKVFYQSNRTGQTAGELQFTANLPLRPGSNVVTVVARESNDTLARRSYIIRRDGPNGELLQTPRRGEETSESDD